MPGPALYAVGPFPGLRNGAGHGAPGRGKSGPACCALLQRNLVGKAAPEREADSPPTSAVGWALPFRCRSAQTLGQGSSCIQAAGPAASSARKGALRLCVVCDSPGPGTVLSTLRALSNFIFVMTHTFQMRKQRHNKVKYYVQGTQPVSSKI